MTLATWASKSLGELSEKYAVKVAKMGGMANSSNALTSMMPLWITLPSIQCLIDLLSRYVYNLFDVYLC